MPIDNNINFNYPMHTCKIGYNHHVYCIYNYMWGGGGG